VIKERLEKAVTEALKTLGAGEVNFVVERPATFEHGDYATNAALVAFGALRAPKKKEFDKQGYSKQGTKQASMMVSLHPEFPNTFEFAKGLAERLHGNIEGVEKIEAEGGFVNFFLSREAIAKEVEQASHNEGWGRNDLYKGKKIMVEYTSPNLFKPLHIGNLIGNILGESVARLFENSGGDVKRLNYPSDIGLTVAKGVYGLLKLNIPTPTNIQELGTAYVLGNEDYESGTEADKKRIEEINKKLYEGSDQELNSLREIGIEISRAHLKKLCETLGTKFNQEFFESQSGPIGTELVLANVGKVFEKSDGAIIYRGEHTRVFLNSQGLPTYEAKEIGLFELKTQQYPNFDISLTVTGKEQQDFFKVVFDAIRKIFPDKIMGKQLLHLPTSFLRLTTGKMSSRKGNTITGETLLAGLKEMAKEKMQGRELADADKVAEQVAVGAVKYAVLKQGSGKDIIFDPVKSLSLEGDSGPYVQYAHTRALSLIREAEKAGITPDTSDAPAEAHALERLLLHYPDVLERAAKELEPHYITTYITELASAFNSWYASERVIGGSAPKYGTLLAQAVEKTLQKGLSALGIPAPEKM